MTPVEWTTPTAATKSWRPLSAVTDATDGIDFQLKVNDQFPWKVNDSEPLTVIDDPQEFP